MGWWVLLCWVGMWRSWVSAGKEPDTVLELEVPTGAGRGFLGASEGAEVKLGPDLE